MKFKAIFHSEQMAKSFFESKIPENKNRHLHSLLFVSNKIFKKSIIEDGRFVSFGNNGNIQNSESLQNLQKLQSLQLRQIKLDSL